MQTRLFIRLVIIYKKQQHKHVVRMAMQLLLKLKLKSFPSHKGPSNRGAMISVSIALSQTPAKPASPVEVRRPNHYAATSCHENKILKIQIKLMCMSKTYACRAQQVCTQVVKSVKWNVITPRLQSICLCTVYTTAITACM